MDPIDELFAEYVDKGVLIPHWSDEEQDLVYTMGPDAKELAPEFYEATLEDLDEMLLNLVELGLLEVEYNEQLEASFGLTEAGRRYVEEEIL